MTRSCAALAAVIGSCCWISAISKVDAADFGNPERVTIQGYNGDAMEPFVTPDGRYLLFNNSNDPKVDTNLHFAERIDDTHFAYRGEIEGANSPKLDAVPTVDASGTLYFVSTRSYDETLSTIYRAHFAEGKIDSPQIVEGVSLNTRGQVNFDVGVSRDGLLLIAVDGTFSGGGVPDAADLVLLNRSGDRFLRYPDSQKIFATVNTEALEYAPALSADGLDLYFTRFAPSWLIFLSDPPAIFVAHRNDTHEPFGMPERIAAIQGFVEAPSLSPDERSLYFHKKGETRFEIWRVTR